MADLPTSSRPGSSPVTAPPARGATRPERRRYPRAITDFSAQLEAAGRSYRTRVINLSMGGALLDCRRITPDPPIAVGDRVFVNIRCRGDLDPFATEGRAVLWQASSHLGSDRERLLAIQFDEVTGPAAEILEELMAQAWAEIRGRAGIGL